MSPHPTQRHKTDELSAEPVMFFYQTTGVNIGVVVGHDVRLMFLIALLIFNLQMAGSTSDDGPETSSSNWFANTGEWGPCGPTPGPWKILIHPNLTPQLESILHVKDTQDEVGPSSS